MKQFIKSKFHLITVGLIAIIFTVIAVFGLGGTGLPSTYYQTGEFDSTTGYNTLIYKIDYSSDNYVLDSVWLNVGSADFKNGNSSVSFISGLASSQSGSFRQVKSRSYINDPSSPKTGEWICIVNSSDVSGYASRTYYSLNISVTTCVKLNEIAFVGSNNGEKSVLTASAVGSGVKNSITSSIENSSEFARSDSAVAAANVLIDETASFDLNKIITDGSYDNSAALSGTEALTVEGVRNFCSGRSYYVGKKANPLGIYMLSVGTAVFGYNALGVRIIPLVFSVANVILLYIVGSFCFGKKRAGVLFSGLYALGGYSLTYAVTSSVNAITLTFLISAFYFFYKFVRKGISNGAPVKSYLNILFGGLCYAFAVCVQSQSAYVGIAFTGIFAFGMVRQYKAYVGRKNSFEYNASAEKTAYLRKMSFTLICGIISLSVLPILLLGVSFLTGYKTLSGYYLTTGLFDYTFAHLKQCFTGSGTGNSIIGWVVNYEAELISDGKYAFGNMVLTFINLFAVLYGLCYVILLLTDKNKNRLDSSVKYGVIMPYIIFVGTFLVSYLMHFVGIGSTGDFYISSVFMSGVTVGLVNTFEKADTKPLFNVGGVSVTVTGLITAVVLAASIVAFGLAVPAFLGLDANASLYSWHLLRGIAV